jgi:hypothetical protein
MDRGVYKTGQDELMEYMETNKPITYVSLNSCIGLTLPGKFGVHLVIPTDESLKLT